MRLTFVLICGGGEFLAVDVAGRPSESQAEARESLSSSLDSFIAAMVARLVMMMIGMMVYAWVYEARRIREGIR